MTNTTAELETRIEQMVAEHVAAVRKAAQAAVERAFTGANTSVAAPSVAPSRPACCAGRLASGATGTELFGAGRALLRGVELQARRDDGSTFGRRWRIACGAAASGARLREANRVRTIGERSQMRYFPLSASASS